MCYLVLCAQNGNALPRRVLSRNCHDGGVEGGVEEEAETKRGNTTPPLIFQFTAPRLTFLCGLESMHLLPETRYSSL